MFEKPGPKRGEPPSYNSLVNLAREKKIKWDNVKTLYGKLRIPYASAFKVEVNRLMAGGPNKKTGLNRRVAEIIAGNNLANYPIKSK
ncbi:MAG: hypothetical protein ABIE23_00655 [archaeon]